MCFSRDVCGDCHFEALVLFELRRAVGRAPSNTSRSSERTSALKLRFQFLYILPSSCGCCGLVDEEPLANMAAICWQTAQQQDLELDCWLPLEAARVLVKGWIGLAELWIVEGGAVQHRAARSVVSEGGGPPA